MKLKCKFGVPHHGWLPVLITCNGFELEFEASAVPVNPINILIYALSKAIDRIDSELEWHLEPSAYRFNFKTSPGAQVNLLISFADSYKTSASSKPLFSCEGTADEIILPFWRAVKEFASHEYGEPHWPPLDNTALSRLTSRVKNASR